MPKQLPYGSSVVLHDGSGHYRSGLVFANRNDLGGPDDEPVITGIALDPKFATNGAARGNITDAVVVFHDLPFVTSKESNGYSFEVFDGEVIAELAPKKIVLPAPVQPVLIDAPVTTSSTLIAQTPPVAIIGGVPVEVESTEVEGVHAPITSLASPATVGKDYRFSETPEKPLETTEPLPNTEVIANTPEKVETASEGEAHPV